MKLDEPEIFLVGIGMIMTACVSTNITPWHIRVHAELHPYFDLDVRRGDASVKQPPARFEAIED